LHLFCFISARATLLSPRVLYLWIKKRNSNSIGRRLHHPAHQETRHEDYPPSGDGGAISLLAGTSLSSMSRAEFGEYLGIREGLEDFWLAPDAYIFGYPLVTMEMTRRAVTNVVKPEGTRAPMGHLIKLREYPNASFRDVTAPNADTLYTTSFIDVGNEPWVLSIPDMKDRYYLFPMLDGWTTVFQVPGKRTTGTSAHTYAITGPGWKGKLRPA
jgi:hypothetical protein